MTVQWGAISFCWLLGSFVFIFMNREGSSGGDIVIQVVVAFVIAVMVSLFGKVVSWFYRLERHVLTMNPSLESRLLTGQLWKDTQDVLYDIFARGVLVTPRRKFVLEAIFVLATNPFLWVQPGFWLHRILSRAIHLGVFLAGWWLLRDSLAPYASVVFTVGVIGVYYTILYSILVDVLIHLSVVITGGETIRWVCRGYLAKEILRRKMLDEELINGLIVFHYSGVMSQPYHRRFFELLTFSSELTITPAPPHAAGTPEAERRNRELLKEMLSDYWKHREIVKNAEAGNADAQYNLGVMYANGTGVPQDDAEAVRWYRLAAEQGFALAQFSLGRMYHYGEGVPQDDAEAMRLYRLAAEQGNARAQYGLGGMYSNGDGVPEDDAEAYLWFNLAATYLDSTLVLGSPFRADRSALRDEFAQVRDAHAEQLTPEQLADAQRRAREFFEAHPPD